MPTQADAFDRLVRSADSPMNRVCEVLRRVAPFDIPVLLTGEPGTGKELAARLLHDASLRRKRPFMIENCGAVPDELLASELFGHRCGALGGALEDHPGLFACADQGTVFLDDIGDVSPAFQTRLLRALREGETRPLGRRRGQTVDVRVIAATDKDLEAEVQAGRFREDLYYRLAPVSIRMPPLRERRCDIGVVAGVLLAAAEKRLGKRVAGLSAEAIACLRDYHWPGNVRELESEIQQLLVMGPQDGQLGADLLSARILHAAPCGAQADRLVAEELDSGGGTLRERLESLEARILRETLIRHRWNKTRAARELGLSRVGLRAKLERHQLERVDAAGVAPVGSTAVTHRRRVTA